MNIQITPTARERMQTYLAGNPQASGVRFGVRRTGCSGFGYVIELAEERRDDDEIVRIDGVSLVIDARSRPLVDGTVIDFQREGLNTHFVFHNPNATGECGCGESFTVDPADD
jgi:iron-sulfur cluster assembly protein